MKNKLLKYNDFINESLLGNVKKMLAGPRTRIKELVNKMVSVEKNYIDKTDELSFNIYSAQAADVRKKFRGSESTPLLKQKALISKRALEAFTKAKNSEVDNIKDDVLRIVRKDKELAKYYNGEAAKGDLAIANYAYEKARKHSDGGYTDSYHKQFIEMEQLRKIVSGVPSETPQGESVPDGDSDKFITFGTFTIPKPYSLKWDKFIEYIEDRSDIELLQWKSDYSAIKFRITKEIGDLHKDLTARKKFLTDEKKKYPANIPLYDVEIDEIERTKRDLDIQFEDVKGKLKMKSEYLHRMTRI